MVVMVVLQNKVKNKSLQSAFLLFLRQNSLMRSRYIKLIILGAMFLFSCGSESKQGSSSPMKEDKLVVLEGSLENGAGLDLVLEEMEARELIPVDTVTCGEEDEFRIEFEAETPGFYILHTGRSAYINLYLEPGENIRLSGTYDNPHEYAITGSPGSEQLMNLGREHRKSLDLLAGITGLLNQSCNLSLVFRIIDGFRRPGPGAVPG